MLPIVHSFLCQKKSICLLCFYLEHVDGVHILHGYHFFEHNLPVFNHANEIYFQPSPHINDMIFPLYLKSIDPLSNQTCCAMISAL